jgi:hypothetical protein
VFTEGITLRGLEATIVWGYRTAAVCKEWTAARTPGGLWTVRATVTRADPFSLKQAGLKFTAPRIGGRFCWPVVAVTLTGSSLAGQLGPPES